MSKPLADKDWLAELLDEELSRYDPEAARGRLPAEARAASTPDDLAPAARILVARSLRHRRLGAAPPPEEAFRDDVRAHVGLALDLALVRGEPFLRARQHAWIAAFLAAAAGDTDAALYVEPEVPGGAGQRDVALALRAAAGALHTRFFPPGDPVGGLPLYPGATAIFRRHLVRVVTGFLRAGKLDPEALFRHARYANRETVLLVEALAGLLASATAAPDGRAGRDRTRTRQVTRLGLDRAGLRAARGALGHPRPAGALALAAPAAMRPFLLEQLLLGQLRAGLQGDGVSSYIAAFVVGGRLEAQTLVAAQVEAAAQHGDHALWFEAVGEAGLAWHDVADQWESMADHVVERVSTAVTENLGAMVTEIRETGELGSLLARAAGGHALTPAEKKKVKAQLVDVAKAVPALAIFAAPGGMLLLPLLAKLLPFNLLPSAWDKAHGPPARALPPGPTLADPADGPAVTPETLADDAEHAAALAPIPGGPPKRGAA